MSKCIINPKHKSSRGSLLNISGASEAVMQSSDFMQFSACMTDKNCYLRKKPICTNYRLHFISYRSRNTIEWHCFDAIMDKTCACWEKLTFRLSKVQVMRRPGAPAINILAAILALLIACCYLHIEAKYPVFWGQISLCKDSTLSTVPWGSQPPFYRIGPLEGDGKAYNWKEGWKNSLRWICVAGFW